MVLLLHLADICQRTTVLRLRKKMETGKTKYHKRENGAATIMKGIEIGQWTQLFVQIP
jgi:hypothetical protein